MVTIKDGCGCEPCDCDWKQKLKEAYSRAIQSVNKIGDNDGSVYFPDGTGFVKLPLPRQSDVAQIYTNTEDIADLKVRDTQLQADIAAETTAREEAITAEASAREAGITAEASAREAGITAEASAREAGITAEASARQAKDTELDAAIARIDNTDAGQDQKIRDNTDRISSTYNDLVSTEATVATHDSEIITLKANNQALAKSLVSDVLMTDGTTAGSVQVSIEREDGALITSANYKWGRDIGVRLEAGTQAGYVKAVISLSDGTELVSNEYKIVEVLESDVYVTAITLVPDMTAGTIGGNISYSNGTTQTINAVNVPTAPGVTSAIEALQSRMTAVEQKNTAQDSQISAIDGRVQALENTPGIGQFANGKLGTIAGSATDGRIKAETDGSGSVNGWSDLKSRVSTAQNDISNLMNDKINVAQGSENAGKALVVGEDGNVAPREISGGKKLFTGTLDDLCSFESGKVWIKRNFTIEYLYIGNDASWRASSCEVFKTSFTGLNDKGTKNFGYAMGFANSNNSSFNYIKWKDGYTVYVNNTKVATQLTDENYTPTSLNEYHYRLWVD